MRSVVVTVGHPSPTRGGVDLRNVQTIDALAQLGPVALFSLGSEEPLLAVDGVEVVHGRSLAKIRSEKGLAERVMNRAWYLRPGSHWRYDSYTSHQVEAAAREFAADWRPDVVVASQLPTSPVARALTSHGARLIFDSHNVEADLRPN